MSLDVEIATDIHLSFNLCLNDPTLVFAVTRVSEHYPTSPLLVFH